MRTGRRLPRHRQCAISARRATTGPGMHPWRSPRRRLRDLVRTSSSPRRPQMIRNDAGGTKLAIADSGCRASRGAADHRASMALAAAFDFAPRSNWLRWCFRHAASLVGMNDLQCGIHAVRCAMTRREMPTAPRLVAAQTRAVHDARGSTDAKASVRWQSTTPRRARASFLDDVSLRHCCRSFGATAANGACPTCELARQRERNSALWRVRLLPPPLEARRRSLFAPMRPAWVSAFSSRLRRAARSLSSPTHPRRRPLRISL